MSQTSKYEVRRDLTTLVGKQMLVDTVIASLETKITSAIDEVRTTATAADHVAYKATRDVASMEIQVRALLSKVAALEARLNAPNI